MSAMPISTLSTVPVHGNYHRYYTKRPFLSDARLAALPANLFHSARVLDIGCNEGWVTCEIAQSHGAHFVVGVDIDDTLVQAAWRRRIAVWSTQAPSQPAKEPPTTDPEEKQQDTSDRAKPAKKRRRDSQGSSDMPLAPALRMPYFPASCEHEFAPLPIPPSVNRGKMTFPHNVSFRTADWTTTHMPEDAEGYDVVVGFSISKWIHLNGGDEGLKRFFQRVYEALKSGGTFVLEPQPWESYAKAKRMNERLKENGKSLTIRPENFASILTDLGFDPARHFGFVGEGGFNRPIDLYTKP